MSNNVFEQDLSVSRQQREEIKNQKGMVLWFTGLSGSGKSTVAAALHKHLTQRGLHSYLLDGDNIRLGINKDLDFSEEGRRENIRRIAEIAKLFVDAGIIVLTAFISPFREDRQSAAQVIGNADFKEVYVDCPLEVCEQRDVKGLYARARMGEIKQFTGIDSPYEPPLNPTITIETNNQTVEQCVNDIIKQLNI